MRSRGIFVDLLSGHWSARPYLLRTSPNLISLLTDRAWKTATQIQKMEPATKNTLFKVRQTTHVSIQLKVDLNTQMSFMANVSQVLYIMNNKC